MIRKIFVPITSEESIALVILAEQERRDPRQQAAFLLRLQLERLGLLQPAPTNPPIQEAADGRRFA